MFGYCFGTSLNFLGRHEEALPVLLVQAEQHLKDALSWFQVAIAREGVGDLSGSIVAYQAAIDLDHEYALAWFNLGGIYWNMGKVYEALNTWNEAKAKFPGHPQIERLRQLFATQDANP